MSIKKWILPKENQPLAKILAEECKTSEFIANILFNRGYKSYLDASQFITGLDEISSPFDMIDMQKAVTRIQTAIENNEKIAIYGDYDCDGVTSVTMLYTYLQTIGADVIYYIPERDGEGYGLNNSAIDFLNENMVTLIITVDNGITAIDEVEYAKTFEIDIVITDHHQAPDVIPKAFAVINPHRKDCKSTFKDLCGAGVCFKLIAALEGDANAALESFGDLVCIGTIGDIVPLVSENRALVNYGINMLKVSENIGLNALIKVAGIKIENLSARDIAFGIVPRINAAGRMGSAKKAVELLLCEDYDEAVTLATQLNDLNQTRKGQENAIMTQINAIISTQQSILSQRVLMFHNENWNGGILGIVASKLVEQYGKPVFLMTGKDVITGSCRSVGEFHVFKALSENAKCLIKYGGHKAAGGFSLEFNKLDAFKKGMLSYAQKNYDIMPVYEFAIDKKLLANDMTIENIGSLKNLEPFGCKNEQPLFLIDNAEIASVTPLSDDKHQRLVLDFEGQKFTALYFNVSSNDFHFSVTSRVSVICYAELNEYNGKISISLKIKDIRPFGFNQEKFFLAKGFYEKIINGEPVQKNVIRAGAPSRENIIVVYKWLNMHNGFCGDIDTLCFELLRYDINYCKMRLILDILFEMELISAAAGFCKITINKVEKKVDITQSVLYKSLQAKLAG